MFQRFISWLRALFGRDPQKTESGSDAARAEEEYKRIDDINFAVIFGQKLSHIAFSDATVEVGGEGERAEIIRGAMDWAMKLSGKIATQVLATGGRVLIPCVTEGGIHVDIVPQERLYVMERDCEKITSCALLADQAVIDDRHYYRWVGYTLANGSLEVRNRATDDGGREVPLTINDNWADIQPEYAIANVERMPFAFLKCPNDNRRDDDVYGASITHGSEWLIARIKAHLKTIAREYTLTRPMLGLDSSLWRYKPDNANGHATVEGLRRTVQDSDLPFIPLEGTIDGEGKAPWMIYAPAIRDEAMYHRLDRLFELLEKSVGTSKGILTARESQAATATEIRAANHDTFTLVDAIRQMWEGGMQDLAYAVDVLSEYAGLTPGGARDDYEISFDWDMSLFESSMETFQQMLELVNMGAMSKAEIRQWVRGGSLEEAQEAVDEISASAPAQTVSPGIRALLAEE